MTQEYTGQQQHVCYLGPRWREILQFDEARRSRAAPDRCRARDRGDRRRLQRRRRPVLDRPPAGPGQPLRLRPAGLGPGRGPGQRCCDEWIAADLRRDDRTGAELRARSWTAPGGPTRATPRRSASASWSARARTTAPTSTATSTRAWGTYHFADRDGVGVDRTVRDRHRASPASTRSRARAATSRSRPAPTSCCCSSTTSRTTHVLHSGTTVIQHIYDTHFEGYDEVEPCSPAGSNRRPLRPARPRKHHLEAGSPTDQRPRMARPGQHLLLPLERHPRHQRPNHLPVRRLWLRGYQAGMVARGSGRRG